MGSEGRSASSRPISVILSYMRCLALDPGNCSGWALFSCGVLVSCGVTKPGKELALDFVDRAIVEIPQIYPRSDVDPNDLVKLAYSAGLLVGTLASGATTRLVRPREWKRQTPKPIHNRRVLGRLGAEERGVYEDAARGIAAGLRNNAIDAIGLGLYAKDVGWFL